MSRLDRDIDNEVGQKSMTGTTVPKIALISSCLILKLSLLILAKLSDFQQSRCHTSFGGFPDRDGFIFGFFNLKGRLHQLKITAYQQCPVHTITTQQ